MVMSVSLILKFSSSSNNLKREGERLQTIRVPVSLTHQKQMQTLEKSVNCSKNHCLSIRAVAELADIDKGSVQQILHEHFNMKMCAQRWC
jgi:hypothetical protein